MKNIYILSFLLCLLSIALQAQLKVNKSLTPNQLVQDVLKGSGVIVTNVTFNGDTANIGSFSGTSNVGFGAGIILASGNAKNIVGPNNTSSAGNGSGTPGDADLDIITTSGTQDAAILEFDFYSGASTVAFEYVFASEEYLEFVGGYNDVFGLFISGPGITGPYSNNAMNIALLPGTTTPVSIFNVNSNSNSQYYVDNGDGANGPQVSDSMVIQYDGFTKVLTATATIVPCQVYHIKIAVADVGDNLYDSGVFLKVKSLIGETADYILTLPSGDKLVENCTDGTLEFILPYSIATNYNIPLSYLGTATNGVDLDLLPSSITIPSGQTSSTLNLNALNDVLTEGNEKLIIIAQTSACSKDTIEINIGDNTPLIIDNQNTISTCNPNVSIAANASGGNGPYNYAWIPNLSSTDTINFNAETYSTASVTVTDQCNTSVTKNFTVSLGESSVEAGRDTTICSGSTVQLGENGEQGATYSWIVNSNLNATNIANPAFQATVPAGATQSFMQKVRKTFNQCVAEDSVLITVVGSPEIALSSTNPQCENSCNGVAMENTNATAITYLWKDKNNVTIGTNSQISNLCAGSYKLTLTNSIGCTASDSVIITQPSALKITGVTINHPRCFGQADGSINLTLTGKSPFTFDWSDGVNTSNNASNLAKGTYSVEIADSNGCKKDTSFVLIEPNQIKVKTINDTTICSGSRILIGENAELGATYSWIVNSNLNATNIANPAFQTTVPAGTTQSFMQKVRKTFNQCVAEDSVLITVVGSPEIALSSTNPQCENSCNGVAMENTNATAITYLWKDKNNVTIGTNSQISNLCAGSYKLTLTNSIGCTASDSVIITQPSALKITGVTITHPRCFGQADGSINLTLTGKSPFTFDWSDGVNTSNNASNLAKGTYSVEIADSNGCKKDTSFVLIEPSTITIAVTEDTTICRKSCITLIAHATGGSGALTYHWSGLGTGGSKQLCVDTVAQTFSVHANDANNCLSASKNVIIHPAAPPEVTLTSSSVKGIFCKGDSINLVATPSGGTAPYMYTWIPNNTDTNKINVTMKNTSNFSVSVTDACGAKSPSSSVDFTIRPNPVFNYEINDLIGCAPQIVSFENNSTEIFSSIEWNISKEGGEPSFVENTNNPKIKLTEQGVYGGFVKLVTAEQCKYEIPLTDSIRIYQAPKANFVVNSNEVFLSNPKINTINLSENAQSNNWIFEDKSPAFYTTKNAEHTYADTGFYNIQLLVISKDGCRDSIAKKIYVIPNFSLYFPNAFSPNHDGVNDEFGGYGNFVASYEMLIFNRWGELIFTSKSINNLWDGTINGNAAQIDTYVYKVIAKDLQGKKHEYLGPVTLVR